MFESADLKLKRAEHHIADLERQFDAFVARRPQRFGIEQDQRTGQPVIQVRFVEEVPQTLGVVIADAVHNLRAVLDHLTWELVGLDGGAQNNRLQFPCGWNRAKFEELCRAIETPSEWVRNYFRGLQAFPHGTGQAFCSLNDLDNTDKHRIIAPVLRATNHPPFRIFNADGSLSTRSEGNLYIGGTGDSVKITNVPAGGHVELEDDAHCTPSIFFSQILMAEVFETLGAFRQSVSTALIEAKRAVGGHPKP